MTQPIKITTRTEADIEAGQKQYLIEQQDIGLTIEIDRYHAIDDGNIMMIVGDTVIGTIGIANGIGFKRA